MLGLSIVSLAAFLFGLLVARVAGTMSSGPREGTRNAGYMIVTVVGLVVSLLSLSFLPVVGAIVVYAATYEGVRLLKR